MSNFFPLVSIVIPVYNGANYLAEAIDSALDQTYQNVEILVINDGSKDEGATRNIALSYGDKIRYFEKENGGVATALNLGIEKMKGAYFSWLSHDDKYFPDKIEKQVNFLSGLTNKEVILYSDLEYIDEDSTFLSQLRFPHYPPENFRPAFILYDLISGCTLLIPKICFETCGIFDIKLRTTQDYDLWFRIAEKFDFIHQPDILILSRQHENQDTIKLNNIINEEKDKLHSHFIKTITEKEIESFSKGNLVGYYIKFAYTMEASRLFKAEKLAFEKAFHKLFRSISIITFQNILKLLLLALLICTRKMLVWIFGNSFYFKLKKTVGKYLKMLFRN